MHFSINFFEDLLNPRKHTFNYNNLQDLRKAREIKRLFFCSRAFEFFEMSYFFIFYFYFFLLNTCIIYTIHLDIPTFSRDHF